MKKLILMIFFAAVFLPLGAGEKVIFIPGWFTEWINYSRHRKLLAELFPGADLQIGKWNSNRLWKNAKHSASLEVKELFTELSTSSDITRTTLIGHSLGGRIIMDCAELLAARNLKVKQIILLGTAGKISGGKLKALQKISAEPVINICCPEDNILKVYCQEENEIPLGFAGIPHPENNFRQYRMYIPDESLKLGKITLVSAKVLDVARQTAAHLAIYYLKTLNTAFSGESPEYYLNYAELEQLASRGSCKLEKTSGFREVETFDEWKLSENKRQNSFRITTPAGKMFHYRNEKTAKENFQLLKHRLKSASLAARR